MNNNKTVLITGIGKGLGKELGKIFYENKYNVCGITRSVEDIEQLNKIFKEKERTLFVHGDVNKNNDLVNFFMDLKTKFGTLNVFINNAGVYEASSIIETSIESFDQTIGINLRAAFIGIKCSISEMKEKGGHIIIIGSMSSKNNYANYASYHASKFGLFGLVFALKEEVKQYKIKVSLINPSKIYTTRWEKLGIDRAECIDPKELAKIIYNTTQYQTYEYNEINIAP
jgi:short-subunit dehydrogenase